MASGETLASLMRAKYPGAYDDLSDQELESKILAKYPQYGDLAKSSSDATDITDEDLQFERNLSLPEAQRNVGYTQQRGGRGGTLPDPAQSEKYGPYAVGAIPLAYAGATVGPVAMATDAALGTAGTFAGAHYGGVVGGWGDKMLGTGHFFERTGQALGGLLVGGLAATKGAPGIVAVAEKLPSSRYTYIIKALAKTLDTGKTTAATDFAMAEGMVAAKIAKNRDDALDLISKMTPEQRMMVVKSSAMRVSEEAAGAPAIRQKDPKLFTQIDEALEKARERMKIPPAQEAAPIATPPTQKPTMKLVEKKVPATETVKAPPPKNESELVMKLSMLYKSDRASRDAVLQAAKNAFPDNWQEVMKQIKFGGQSMPGRYR